MVRVFSYLQRNPSSGILYFRLRVPSHLRQVVGKWEFKFSLGTTEKSIAIPLAMRQYIDLKKQFQYIEQGIIMSKKNSPETLAPHLAPQKIVVDLPGSGKIEFDTGNDDKDLELAKKFLSSTDRPISQPIVPVSDSPTLMKAAKEFREEKMMEGSWRKKTHDEHEAVHELVKQVLGNKALDTFTIADGRRFKKALQKLPPNMNKGQYAGKSFLQIIAMEPKCTLAPRTINEKLQRISSLFTWSIKQGYCQTDPFGELKLSIKRKPSEEKDAFTTDDLRAIFHRDHFSLNKLDHEWQYWMPLLALYTGARAQELAQLRIIDVFEKDGIHALKITKEAGSVKSLASERDIPIHPSLINSGFLEIVARQAENGNERLFPELHDNESLPNMIVSKWFNRTYLKHVGLRPTKRKISLHSFRHTFIDCLKQMDIPEPKAKALSGHAHEGITYNRYGKDYDISALYEVICKLDPFGNKKEDKSINLQLE